jgi:hypothetical protein
MDVDGISNHHILYSADETWVGAFSWVGEHLVPLRYPVEPLLERFNSLKDGKGSGS